MKPKKDMKQTSFQSTSDEIMRQIGETHPELVDLFPCYLGKKRNRQKIMNIVLYSTVKGVGPYAMVENLVS